MANTERLIGGRKFVRVPNSLGFEDWLEDGLRTGNTITVKPGEDPEPVQKTAIERDRSASLVRAVKAQASKVIRRAYPEWKQLNILAEGGEALKTMRTFIDAVRKASDEIEKKPPEDFIGVTSDKRWPAVPK